MSGARRMSFLISLHEPHAPADHEHGDREPDEELDLIVDAPPSAGVAVHDAPQSREHDADRDRIRRERACWVCSATAFAAMHAVSFDAHGVTATEGPFG
jgi:hypothetical protein